MNAPKNRFDAITVNQKDIEAYNIFEWVATKDKPENYGGSNHASDVVLKRKIPFGQNPALAQCEKNYFKLYHKKYRKKPILGILSFILMVAFFAVAVFELYIGLSGAFASPKNTEEANAAVPVANADEDEETADEEETDTNGGFKGIIDNINNKIFAPIVNTLLKDTVVQITDPTLISVDEDGNEYIPEGKKIPVTKDDADSEATTTEITVPSDSSIKIDSNGTKYIYISGTAKLFSVPALAEKIGMEKFLTAEVLVGLVALIFFIVFLIIFISIATIGKKRKKKYETLAEMEYEARAIVNSIYDRNPQLYNKYKRREIMWTNIIANGIRQATMSNNMVNDDDEDED